MGSLCPSECLLYALKWLKHVTPSYKRYSIFRNVKIYGQCKDLRAPAALHAFAIALLHIGAASTLSGVFAIGGTVRDPFR